MRRYVRSRKLVDEEALDHWGAVAPKTKKTAVDVGVLSKPLPESMICICSIRQRLTIQSFSLMMMITIIMMVSLKVTASCTTCTGSFPGVKRPGRGADPPPPSSVARS